MAVTQNRLRSGGDNGFFSRIIPDFEAGLGRLGSDVLPAWISRRLGVDGILYGNTRNADTEAPTVDDFFSSITDRIGEAAGRAAADRAMNRGIIVAGIVAAVVALGAVIVYRKRR
jgi:hypothetical protein